MTFSAPRWDQRSRSFSAVIPPRDPWRYVRFRVLGLDMYGFILRVSRVPLRAWVFKSSLFRVPFIIKALTITNTILGGSLLYF